MLRLEIINKENYIYCLQDENGNKYTFNLEFLDIEKIPDMGDYIWFSSELLNSEYEGYSTMYVFGSLENKYGKENISLDDIDVIKLELNSDEIFLKRLYG